MIRIEVLGGLGIALKRWPQVLLIGGMFAIAALVLSLVLSDVLTQVAVLRGGYELRARRATAFTAYYPEPGKAAAPDGLVSRVPDATIKLLASRVEAGEAYSAITSNLQLDNANFAEGHRVIVVFGDAVRSALPGSRLCRPVPCAMQGSGLVGHAIAPIRFAGRRFAPDSILAAPATFFDPNLAGVPLGTTILIRLPADDLFRLNPIEREEALTRSVLLNPRPAVLDAFVAGSAGGGLRLVPQELAVQQSGRLQDVMATSGIYVLGFAAFLALLTVTFASSVAQTLRREAKSLAIRRLWGATPLALHIRVGVFVGVTTLVVPMAPLTLLFMMGDPFAGAVGVVAAVMACIFVAVWLSASRSVVAGVWTR